MTNFDFEDTVANFNDFDSINMNLIAQIQQQNKRNTQGASVMILCMVAFCIEFVTYGR